jgi:GNAT superfamily N-acetyltransferase
MGMTAGRPAAEIDVGRAIDVLARAFRADPITRWAWPDDAVYDRHFAGFAVAFAGAAFAHGTALVDDDYAGAALWLPPGAHANEEALGAIIAMTVAEERQVHLFELVELQANTHPQAPHWYLPLIGVHPAHQGKGVGSRLLTRSLQLSDEQGLPAYLEATSPGSRDLYQRFGFEVVTELQVADSPPMWPMLRRPR